MVEIKKGDFIEIDYTGKFSDGKVFDTSVEETGKKEGINKPKFDPLVVCVGNGQVIKGLDKKLEGTEVGKDYTFEIDTEEAYGKKDPKLVRVISKNIFTKQKMNPYPGMQINAENMAGIVRSVSGGRIFVDFNHPLAGKDLIFEVNVRKLLTELKEKVEATLGGYLMLDPAKYDIEVKEKNVKINFKFAMPETMFEVLEKKIKEMLPEIKEIKFKNPENESTTSE
jgi:FKBP-type peptidyl-prolyl cis-trans isomerase 2